MTATVSLEGVLVRWNDARGFGFVEAPGGSDVFVHINDFPRGSGRPVRGDRVQVVVAAGVSHRRKAESARLVGVRRMPRGRGYPAWLTVAVLAAALGLTAALAAAGVLSLWVPALVVVMSAVTFGLYASDKRAAVEGRWRVPESTLLVAGLFGGWPGGLLAQRLLRHKTRKRGFLALFWLTVLVDVALVAAAALLTGR